MDLLPGFLSGLTRVIISYPFDYIKLHIQTSTKIEFKNVKISTLYRGAIIPFLTTPIDRGITFYLYNLLKDKGYNKFSSSLLVNLASCIYNTPIQVYNINYIVKDEIIKNNFYKGFHIEYLKNILGGTIFLYTYEKSKELSIIKDSYYIGLYSGIISSIINWSIIYPIDTIKTLIQTDFKNHISISNKIKKEGFKSLYKGISLMYLKSIPSASLGMLIYEITLNKVKCYKNI
jgi:hypothetical protein